MDTPTPSSKTSAEVMTNTQAQSRPSARKRLIVQEQQQTAALCHPFAQLLQGHSLQVISCQTRRISTEHNTTRSAQRTVEPALEVVLERQQILELEGQRLAIAAELCMLFLVGSEREQSQNPQ